MRASIKDHIGKTKPGQKYGKWIVLGVEFHYDRKWRVVCECECGLIDVIIVSALMSNTSTSCRVCGRVKCKEIKIGDKFGKMTAVSDRFYDQSRKNNKWRVNVECACGWSGEIDAKRLFRGTEYHQGCKYYCHGEYSSGWNGYEEICGAKWYKINLRAQISKLEFSITIQDAWQKLVEQNHKCALTDWDIKISRDPIPEYYKMITASLDRIDSSLGYIIGNIQWVHKDVNACKWNLDQQRFIDFCYLINSHPIRKLPNLEIEVMKRYKSFKGVGNISLSKWNRIKSNSSAGRRRKNRKRYCIEFDLKIEYIWDIYLKQNGRCALTGIPIYFDLFGFNGEKHNKQVGEGTASLDRINSTKGYQIGNVQWVHKDVNIMKLDFCTDYFKKICGAISTKYKPSVDIENLLQPIVFRNLKS